MVADEHGLTLNLIYWIEYKYGSSPLPLSLSNFFACYLIIYLFNWLYLRMILKGPILIPNSNWPPTPSQIKYKYQNINRYLTSFGSFIWTPES